MLSDPGNSQFIPRPPSSVDTFSISSYSSTGDDYDSVLAHGSVDNLASYRPIPARHRPDGRPATNGLWQAQFFDPHQWLYTLERSADFAPGSQLPPPTPATETIHGIAGCTIRRRRAFYRVRASTVSA